MNDLKEQFRQRRQNVDRGAPLPVQYESVLGSMGLLQERGLALQVAPAFAALADQMMMQAMADPQRGDGRAAVSPSARLATERRERSEARGQMAMDLDLHGSSTSRLKDHLSFTFWIVDGEEVRVDDILQDALRRAQVMSDLAGEEVEARKRHDLARRDVLVWAELKARADAAETAMAAE